MESMTMCVIDKYIQSLACYNLYRLILGGSLFFFIACGAVAGGTEGGNDMVVPSNIDIADLSPDIIPLISNQNVQMILAEIISVDLVNSVDGDLEVNIGNIDVRVVEVLNGRFLYPGIIVRVPVKRISDPFIRRRNNFNQWNNLALNKGSWLVLACDIQAIDKPCNGLAAIPVSSPLDTNVQAVRICYQIEHDLRAGLPTNSLLQQALSSPNELLFYYALDTVAKRMVLGRENGVAIIDHAMWSGDVSGDRRREFASILTDSNLFDIRHNVDHVNAKILSILTKGLLEERELDERLFWSRRISNMILRELSPVASEDHALRMELLRSVQNPQPIINALAEMDRTLTGGDKEIVQELLAAWRDAR